MNSDGIKQNSIYPGPRQQQAPAVNSVRWDALAKQGPSRDDLRPPMVTALQAGLTPPASHTVQGKRDTDVVVSDANKFGVRLVDLSTLPHARVCTLLDQARQSNGLQRSFLIPGDYPVPPGMREIGRAVDLRCDLPQQPMPETATKLAEQARLVVLADSRIPHIVHGTKAAGHVSLTAQVAVPPGFAAMFQQRRGRPLTRADFLHLPADRGAPSATLDLLVCGVTGSDVTYDEYANSYTDFGGSADVVNGRLESGCEAVLREVREEAGDLFDLVGTVHAETGWKKNRRIEVGGPFYMLVDDAYTKAVSSRSLSLPDFCDILRRANPDGRELLDLAVVALPADAPRRAPHQGVDVAKRALEIYLKDTWFASRDKAPDAAAQAAADKNAARLAHMACKVFASRGWLGEPYPDTWHAGGRRSRG